MHCIIFAFAQWNECLLFFCLTKAFHESDLIFGRKARHDKKKVKMIPVFAYPISFKRSFCCNWKVTKALQAPKRRNFVAFWPFAIDLNCNQQLHYVSHKCSENTQRPQFHAAMRVHELWIFRSNRYHNLYTVFFVSYSIQLFVDSRVITTMEYGVCVCIFMHIFALPSRPMSIRMILLVPAWHISFHFSLNHFSHSNSVHCSWLPQPIIQPCCNDEIIWYTKKNWRKEYTHQKKATNQIAEHNSCLHVALLQMCRVYACFSLVLFAVFTQAVGRVQFDSGNISKRVKVSHIVRENNCALQIKKRQRQQQQRAKPREKWMASTAHGRGKKEEMQREFRNSRTEYTLNGVSTELQCVLLSGTACDSIKLKKLAKAEKNAEKFMQQNVTHIILHVFFIRLFLHLFNGVLLCVPCAGLFASRLRLRLGVTTPLLVLLVNKRENKRSLQFHVERCLWMCVCVC